ncbi:hypothetical protein [Nocardia sp. NPDC024068]|uniref:hypothetical protein n=1 Tax=Nocardia sp. NPDC024068 TaxID=3157197 RepID=UPI0033FC1E3D
MYRSRRSVVTSASAFAALTVALVAAAPTAPAAVTDFRVTPGIDWGSSSSAFGTGCSYTATAAAEPGEYVSFYDSQKGSFDPPGAILVGKSGTVTARWTPHTRGTHNLHAEQIGSRQSVVVEVGTGVDLGSACPVL